MTTAEEFMLETGERTDAGVDARRSGSYSLRHTPPVRRRPVVAATAVALGLVLGSGALAVLALLGA